MLETKLWFFFISFRMDTVALRMQSVCRRFGACSTCLNRQLNGFLGLRNRTPLPSHACIRTIYSETGRWEKNYGQETRRRVENWWFPRIKEQFCRISETDVSIVRNLEITFDIFVSLK